MVVVGDRGESVVPAMAQETGLHASIDADLQEMMRDKSHGQLLVGLFSLSSPPLLAFSFPYSSQRSGQPSADPWMFKLMHCE
jgi:hypothetical protein